MSHYAWLLMIPSPSRPKHHSDRESLSSEEEQPYQKSQPTAFMRKKVDSLPLTFARANSPRACFDCLVLIELTLLSVPSCLYGEKLARLRGRPNNH